MPITVSQITNQDGSGIFDILMQRMNVELSDQFQAKRISGKEYAEVYLGALTSVLAQSIQYVTSVQTADAQVALMNAQKIQVETQTLQAIEETKNIQAQKLQIEGQTAYIASQKLQLDAQKLLTDAETAKAISEKLVIDKQVLKLDKDILIAAKQLEILAEQLIKSGVETSLLEAKVNTEKAQYLDSVNALPVAGIIGRQKDLYTRQGEGFIRDAEQKLLKIMSDIWAIQKSTDPAEIDPNDTGMHDGNIRVVALKAIQGIGGTPVAPPTVPTP